MVVACIALVVAVGGVAVASIPDRGGVVHACYQKNGGGLRVIDTAGRGFAGKCRKSEKPLAWNEQGPRGLQGIQGVQGSQGLLGPKGDKGDPGAQGQQGPGAQWALVNPDGTIRAQSGGISVSVSSPGVYYVDFGTSASAKMIAATENKLDSESAFVRGPIVVSLCGGTQGSSCIDPIHNNDHTVIVFTNTNDAQSPQARSFYIAVF
jgi:hypothetical protein